MSEFKSIILGLCIASITLGVIYMLKPCGVTDKSVRLSFAVIFLSILVLSVVRILGTDFEEVKISVSSNSTNSESEILCVETEYLCEKILEEKGIEFSEINIFTDKNEQGSIFIKRITVESAEEPEAIIQSITDVVLTDGVEVIND